MKINLLNQSKLKKLKSKKFLIILAGIFLIVFVAFSALNKPQLNEQPASSEKIQVKTAVLGQSTSSVSYIETTGRVKADNKVNLVAMTSGTLRNLFFEVGDKINQNQILGQIYDSAVLTNLNTAQAGYNNLRQSLEITKQSTQENIKQAEIALESARESVRVAEVGLKTAKDNYSNSLNLQKNRTADTYANAVVSFDDFLSGVNNALNQVDYIIGADGSYQISGIEKTIALLNPESLNIAEENYFSAKNLYQDLLEANVNEQNIVHQTSRAVNLLSQTRIAINSAINVLDNTLPSSSFSEATLNAQKSNLNNLRNIISGSLTSVQSIKQNLNNLSLNNKQQSDGLANAVKTAENQLELAKLSYKNAEVQLQNARQAKDQQIIAAQSSLNNAGGQLSLASSQAADLTLKAPISGQITGKFASVGTEVSPGFKVAEISQKDLLKIETDIDSDDIYSIQVGNQALVNNKYEARVININPSADPVTKKVRVELALNEKDANLIPETFVDLIIFTSDNQSEPDASENNLNTLFNLPLDAVIISQNKNYVFVNQNGVAKMKEVEIGEINADQVQVLSGLNTQDEIIIQGNRQLEDGQPIEISN